MSPGRVFSFSEARKNAVEAPGARWADVAAEFSGDVFPKTLPSFAIERGETVLGLGVGFARSLEQHLAHAGCNAPIREFRLPETEWRGDAAEALSQLHPPAVRQSLEWTARIMDRDGVVTWDDCAPLAYVCADGLFADLGLGLTPPATRERFLERRQQIYDVMKSAFSAHCLVIAPTLIEAWREAESGLYCHDTPSRREMLRRSERMQLEVLTYEQCLADLLAAIDVVRARNADAKVLIAVSPEPTALTFTGQDVRLANTEAKSVLRAACAAVAAARPMVDYVPVYEAAVLSHPKMAWEQDRQNLSAGFMVKTARRVMDLYLKGEPKAAVEPKVANEPKAASPAKGANEPKAVKAAKAAKAAKDAGEAGSGAGFKTARALLHKHKFAEAEAAARALLKDHPDDLEVAMIVVEALIGRFRGDEAEQEVKPWVERYPDRADLRVAQARAMARSDRGRLPEAILEINSASKMESMGMAEFRAVSELVRRKAPSTMAENITRLAVERFPNEPEAHGYLIEVLADRGKLAEARAQLRKALELPNAPSIMRLQLAELLIEAGEAEEARTLLKSVLADGPQSEEARTLLERLKAASAPEAS
jgi:FimV-like protein